MQLDEVTVSVPNYPPLMALFEQIDFDHVLYEISLVRVLPRLHIHLDKLAVFSVVEVLVDQILDQLQIAINGLIDLHIHAWIELTLSQAAEIY